MGGCTVPDQEILDPVASFEIARDCNTECGLDDDACVRACLEAGLSVTVECGLCFVSQAACADETCIVECIEEGDECDTCRFGACIVQLEECTQTEVNLIDDDPLSRVRVLHMTPDAANINGYLQGEEFPFATDITFGSASDSSTRFAFTSETIEVREAADGLSGSVLYEATFPQTPGSTEVWTLATYGSVADATSWLLVHDLNDRPGTVRWQFFNAASLLGEVDVYDLGGAEPLELTADLAYGGSTERTTAEAGAHTLGIDTDDDAEIDYRFTVGPFEFGTEVSFFLFDDGASSVFLMAAYVNGQMIRYNPGS
ncbi:MAG: hypothetical protein ACJAYU_001564 [Bradymonadia bacterium]